jgi:hypothetical protein
MEDKSIFNGIVQFKGPDGHEYRAEEGDNGLWGISKLRGDAYLSLGRTYAAGDPKDIWNAMQDLIGPDWLPVK